MTYRYLATVVAVSALVPGAAFGQGNLSIKNYQYVSEQRVSRTSSIVTYRADLVNNGPALASVQATLTSLNPASFTVPAGQGILNFAPVPANSQVTSSNTFSILVDRSVTFDQTFGQLQWSFQTVPLAPVANAGANQSATVGKTVTLDGSKSTNPSGVGTLMFSWAFTSRPAGSSAMLINPTSVTPTFVPDVAGNYVIQLTVSNGVASSTASVTVSTTSPAPPVANAGPNQTVNVGATVVLNGSGSTSGSGNPLTYAWTLTSKPAGSTATLTGANTVSPTFVVDKAGSYVAQLIVNDGVTSSAPSTVTISTSCVKPVANAGPNQVVNVNSVVQLNGSGSTDACGLPLTYQWTLLTVPAGSLATLSNPAAVNPTFTADRPGTFTAQLIVNNGSLSSDPATVMITTNALPPTANAGTNQTVNVGSTVQLTGSGTDPQNLPLTFQWTLTSKPAGSAATLSSSTIANPTFVADVAGTYVAQLVVNNGFQSSAASTVTISTTCSQPTANPGPNQNVTVGATVKLDGSASGDACHDPLTYSWSLTTRPAGSNATLTGANTVSPTFVADVAGMYVAQLIVNNGFTSSNPATVTVTAVNQSTIAVTPNPLTVTTNAPGTLTVTLSSAAGGAGQIVNLSSSNTGVATVPATVTVPSGATSMTFSVTGVAPGSATITASANNFVSGTSTVNVVTPVINVPANTPVALGQSAAFTVTLSQAAPAGGVTVNLSSSDTSKVTVPASFSIAAGATTPATQPQVTGAGIGSATITASATGYTSGSGTVTVSAPTMSFAGSLSITVGQTGNLTLNLSGGQAPAGGLTVNLSSSDTSKATVPATVSFAAGATSVQVPVTGVAGGSATITASATGIPNATANVTVATLLINVPANTTVALGQSATFTVTLSQAAPAGGVTVNLSSSDTSKVTVPASVSIAAGATTPATQPQVTGAGIGSATITASATGYTSGTGTVTVTPPTMTFAGSLSINVGQTGILTLNLSGGQAPAGGLTVNLSSSDTGKATVPATVSFAAGATSVQVPVTGVAGGTATITASATGIQNATANVTIVSPTINVPANTTVALGQSATFAVTLSQAAPAGGVTVNLSSSDTSKVTVPASVSIAAGATTPATQPQVTGAGIGSATITASATGYTSGSGTVNVSPPTMSFAGSLSINVGQTGNLTLNLSNGQAPAGGLTVNLSSSDTSKATVPATVSFAAGATSVQVPVTGVAAGSAVITASATGITNATANVTVTQPVTVPTLAFSPNTMTVAQGSQQNLSLTVTPGQASAFVVNLSSSNTGAATVPASINVPANATSVIVPVTGVSGGSTTITASAAGAVNATATVNVCSGCSTITVTPGSVGVNLQTLITITLNPAPPNGATITLTSGDPSIFLVAAQGTAAGDVSTTLNLSAGVGQTQAFIQGIGVGTAALTASSPGFGSGTSTVTVTPSGFVVSGPNGIGSSFQTFPLVNSQLTVNSAQLDANNNFLQVQQLRPGASATVQLDNSNPAAGSVSPPSVSFTGGVDTRTVTFTGGSPGSTTVTATPPAGFATPKTGGLPANSLFITVQPQGLVPQNATVGKGLETTTFTKLNGVASQSECPGTGGLLVTLKSDNPSLLLLSTTATGAGSSQIMVCVPPGASRTPDYFVYGLANSGNATYTASSSLGNSSSTCAGPTPVGCVTFVPSGIVIAGPSGNPGQGFTTGVQLGTTNVSLLSVTLNGGAVGVPQAIAGGTSVSVNVSNSNPAAGTLSPTPVPIPAGSSSGTATFTPLAAGMTNLSIAAQPPGFSTPDPSLTSITATVSSPGCSLTDNIAIGNNLEVQGALNCSVAPVADTVFTLTSNSPGLKLSTTAAGAGSSSIQVTLQAGTTSAKYYLQSTASSGNATYSGSGSGYTVKEVKAISLTPSGFVIVGPFGIGQGWNFPASVSVGSQTSLQILPAQLDASNNFVQPELLSGSAAAAMVPIVVNGVGGVTPSPVIVMPGSDGALTKFSSATTGSSKVSINQPDGYTKPVGVQGFQMPGPTCPSVAQCPDPTFVVFTVQ